MHFEVNVTAENLEKQKKRASVKPNLPTWGNFIMHSDEGTALRGDDEAPCPLNYFSAGIAFCLLSHVAEYSESNGIKLDSAKLEMRQQFHCTVTDTKVVAEEGLGGGTSGIEVHLLLESEESDEVLQKLYRECIEACLALQSIVQAVPLESKLHVKGNVLDVYK